MTYSQLSTTVRANKGFAWTLGVIFVGALVALGAFTYTARAEDATSTDPVDPPKEEVTDSLPTEDTEALCSDGVDNDEDGDTDLEDSDCADFIPVPDAPADTDEDGIADDADNCPDVANPDQADLDDDGSGDACDDTDDSVVVEQKKEPETGGGGGEPTGNDLDEDGVVDDEDNCPITENPGQEDSDKNDVGDVCEDLTGEPQDNPGEGLRALSFFGGGGHDYPEKVDICHANEGNGWTDNNVSLFSILKKHGHKDHDEDIIPPFWYKIVIVPFYFPGLNWDSEGQAIWENDCEQPEEITIIAQKIVCEYESDLPNWGGSEHETIDANTAVSYVQKYENCELVSWDFEWSYGDIGNPGDNLTTTGGAGWNAFDSGEATVDVSEVPNNQIRVREIPQDGYIPFTGQNTDQDVSAELYCTGDTVNYDNWEWISNPEAGETYYCVAWNVLEQRENFCRVDVVSDETNKVVETGLFAVPTYDGHPAWTASIPGATWIWKAFHVENPTQDETYTFKKTFAVEDVNDALLSVASDNSYEVFINGDPVAADANEDNFHLGTQDNDIDVASYLDENSLNTIEVRVKNWALGGGTWENNPAGALYKLIVNAESKEMCEQPPGEDDTTDVTICKLDDEKNYLPGWTVMLLGDYVESVEVPSNGTEVFSLASLDSGTSYAFIADGTYVYRPGAEGDISDPAFTKRSYAGDPIDPTGHPYEPWVDVNDLPSGVEGYLGIAIDGDVAGTNWSDIYNSLHTYALGYGGNDASVGFKIWDDNYGDNSGSLNVEIYEGYVGVTEDDGCVTFEDVPNGEYTLDEILQDGWTNEEGKGESVDVPQEQYDLVAIYDEPKGEDETVFYLVNSEENQCEEGPTWAAEVIEYSQGKQKGGNSVPPARSDEESVLGEPDAVDGVESGFFALGFGGEITVEFEQYVVDVEDENDLSIHETTWGAIDGYPEETAEVWVSQYNNGDWYPLGEASNLTLPDRVTYFDLADIGLPWIKYVRIVDITNPDIHGSSADGFDIDAIDATYGVCEEPEDEPICDPEVNLIENGGFESPLVTLAQQWELFPSGGPLVWFVDWMTGGSGDLELQAGVNGWLPYEGDQYAELDTHGNGPGSNVKIYQDVDTEDGEVYTLSFAFSPRPNTNAADNEFEVWWNGNLLDTISEGNVTNSTDWGVYTYDNLLGDDTSTVEFRAIGTQNTLGTFIDGVALYCDPNPEPECLIEGHKFDEEGNPLEGWTIGLFEFVPEFAAQDILQIVQEGTGPFPSATSGTILDEEVTDENGYYCLFAEDVDQFGYGVYEVLKDGWSSDHMTMGDSDHSDDPGEEVNRYTSDQFDIFTFVEFDSKDVIHVDFYNEEENGGGSNGDGGSITIFKQDESNTDQKFEFTSDSFSNFTLGDNEQEVFSGLSAGNYTFNEILPNGWSDPVVSCDDDNSGEGDSDDLVVSLEEDEDVVCTFQNRLPDNPPQNNDNPGGGGGTSFRRGGGSSGGGQVAGASTDFCPFLRDYQHISFQNDPYEVNKAKAFFNAYLGKSLVLDGIFDQAMFDAVVEFQKLFKPDVLDTWASAFAFLDDEPTGYLYQTTRWKINSIMCPGYEAFPTTLIPDSRGTSIVSR